MHSVSFQYLSCVIRAVDISGTLYFLYNDILTFTGIPSDTPIWTLMCVPSSGRIRLNIPDITNGKNGLFIEQCYMLPILSFAQHSVPNFDSSKTDWLLSTIKSYKGGDSLG